MGNMGPGTLLTFPVLMCLLVLAASRELAQLPLIKSLNSYMDCGSAPACGVLTLETGFGEGYYEHDLPVIHGLWPQVPPYGNSACLTPESKKPPEFDWKHHQKLSCYDTEMPEHHRKKAYAQEYQFVTHEWGKHGMCTGVNNATEFLATVCGLAWDPLDVMADAKSDGASSVDKIADALRDAGYPVFSVDNGYGQQIELSACSNDNGKWHLAEVEDFDDVCGDGGPPRPRPSPAEECIPMQHGPACSRDKDCKHISGCVRCASSGFCTDVRLTVEDVA